MTEASAVERIAAAAGLTTEQAEEIAAQAIQQFGLKDPVVTEVVCTCPQGWSDPRRHSGWCALTGAPNKAATENRCRVVGRVVSTYPVRLS